MQCPVNEDKSVIYILLGYKNRRFQTFNDTIRRETYRTTCRGWITPGWTS